MSEHLHRNHPAEDKLLTIGEAAAIVRAPVATLRYWRHLGVGPCGFRVGRGLRYWRQDVLDWARRAARVHWAGSGLSFPHLLQPRARFALCRSRSRS
jgi:hypothetical protein